MLSSPYCTTYIMIWIYDIISNIFIIFCTMYAPSVPDAGATFNMDVFHAIYLVIVLVSPI